MLDDRMAFLGIHRHRPKFLMEFPMNQLSVVTALMVGLTSTILHAEITLPTLQEARKISRASGRPILAMAGKKT